VKFDSAKHKQYLIGYSILSFLLVFVFSFVVLYLVENEVRTARIGELKSQEQRVVTLENEYLGREFAMILSDLHYLHHAFESDLYSSDYSKVVENWVEFSTQRRIYDQIRFLDANGEEQIRINIGPDGGYAVPKQDLQNKKDRYYFIETVKLKEESVYVSPLDLNVEKGEIEVPYKPMIRLSTPLYDEQGTLKGIIVLNYLAEFLLSGFRDLADNSQGEIILLNALGYSLSSANPSNDWGFMFDDKKEDSFKKSNPNIWQSILKNEGQVTIKEGLVTAAPVLLSHKFVITETGYHDQKIIFGDGNWYVVSVFERNQANSGYFDEEFTSVIMHVFSENDLFFLMIFMISTVIGLLVYYNRKTYSRIKFYSEYDPLTKVFNRRAGIEKLHALFPMDERRHFHVSICFIDINGLKEVNDTLGHKFGDELIKSVAHIIKKTIRDQDFLVRLGGDEFLIVFNGIGTEGAEVIWKRIVAVYEKINEEENKPYLISVSHGIVDFDNHQRTHVDELINAADEIMYHEKQRIKADLMVIK